MKIWITPPYADDGIWETEVIGEPKPDEITYRLHGMIHTSWSYREESTWHRTRSAAVMAAREFRQKRIRTHLSEAERIASLPPII